LPDSRSFGPSSRPFDILAVILLAVSEPEQTLLEDGILAVPERQREAQPQRVSEMPAMPASP